jgi:hypothetical protein
LYLCKDVNEHGPVAQQVFALDQRAMTGDEDRVGPGNLANQVDINSRALIIRNSWDSATALQ